MSDEILNGAAAESQAQPQGPSFSWTGLSTNAPASF